MDRSRHPSRSVAIIGLIAVAALAWGPREGRGETVAPRYPVPTHISKESQAMLAAPIVVDDGPVPRTMEEWLAAQVETNARLWEFNAPRIDQADVTITKKMMAGVPVREIVPKAPRKPRAGKVLMNVHGGAYWLMGGKLSVKEGVGLADVGRYRVVSVDYRTPPRHPFPAAVEDGIAVYRKLLESYGAKDIAIFGTSAGGGLAAAVTIAARDAGLPLPAAVIMHTPWADLSKTGDSYFTNDRVDPIIPTYDGSMAAAAKLYAGDAGLKHPLVSPVYADFRPGFPPALLSTGTRDLLLSATVRLHRELRRAGIPAELHVFDAMWHGLSNMPEGQELQREVLVFLAEHLGD